MYSFFLQVIDGSWMCMLHRKQHNCDAYDLMFMYALSLWLVNICMGRASFFDNLVIKLVWILYGWWLLKEGTSQNVPIAEFEMILRTYNLPAISFTNPKILGTFCDVSDNKVAICYIIWLPIALPGFCISCRNLHSSVISSAVQCVSIVLCVQ